MTDKPDKNTDPQGGLETYFAAARKTGLQPSPDLFARILADAQTSKTASLASQNPNFPRKRTGVFANILADIGGWPTAAGMGLATIVGVWIGFSQPVGLDFLADSLLGSNNFLVDLETGFDTEIWEG